jgi:hypothetical protein
LRLFVRNQLNDALRVGVAHDGRFPEIPFSLLGLFGQDMTLKSVIPLHLPRTRDVEPFGGAAVGFHLWHDDSISSLSA